VLFVAGAVVIGARPAFDSPAAEVVAHLGAQRARIQVGVVLQAASAPLFVWFLATVARTGLPGAIAFGCGLVFIALFLADLTALAVGALRPENLAPEVAAALRDFEWLAMGVAAFAVAGMLTAFAAMTIWPRWVGWLAAVAAAAYALRIGTIFTTEGAFAADGVLGLYVPVAAFAAWTLVASASIALRPQGYAPVRDDRP
jgi:hypothetical protein